MCLKHCVKVVKKLWNVVSDNKPEPQSLGPASQWAVSVLRQLTSGEVWVQFNDGSQLVVQAGVSCITYTSPDGRITRYETPQWGHPSLGFLSGCLTMFLLSPLPPTGTKRMRSFRSTSRRSCTASPPSWAYWPTPRCTTSVIDGWLLSAAPSLLWKAENLCVYVLSCVFVNICFFYMYIRL